MKTVRVSEAESKLSPHQILIKPLYDTENAQVVHVELRPGESLTRHVTPVDVFFYVLEGEGIVEVGDERMTVAADTLIESPKGIPHTLINENKANFRVLVVKVPRPVNRPKLL